MKDYRLSARKYFDHFMAGFAEEFERTREPMIGLIDRYDLRDMDVLAVGPGVGSEEYWLHAYGQCRLCFVDLDEHQSLESAIRDQGLAVEAAESDLRFLIGDAAALPANLGRFDLIYASSFTPEETRRREIRRRSQGWTMRVLRAILRRHPPWPRQKAPFGDVLHHILGTNLRDDGLFIEQSYASGVSAALNPNLVAAMRQQLAELSIEMLEQFYWSSVPTTMITVSQRGDLASAMRRMRRVHDQPMLAHFRGRTTLPQGRILESYGIGAECDSGTGDS